MPLVLIKTESLFDYRFDSETLFSDLTAKAQETLSQIKYTTHFQKGETVFAAGDLPQRLYILRKGNAQMLPGSETNNEQEARPIEPNEILGLTEIVANLPYETTAEATEPCEVEVINREDFIRFLREEREVCFRLAHLLALNLQKSYKLLCLQSFETPFKELINGSQ